MENVRAPRLGPAAATKSALSKYATFSGRARRSEFWWSYLVFALLYGAALGLDSIVGTQFLSIVVVIGLFLPLLAVWVRRLHDTDRSGWLMLVGIIPVVGDVLLIVWAVSDSTGDNRFGPFPKWAAPASGT